MREVRHTFEHLLIILGVFFLCLAIIFAIPSVRIWAFQNIPAAVAGVSGTTYMSNIMAGVDPRLMAEVINDDETREELIELWKDSLPGMEPDALAEMGNELLADPNTAALIVDLIAELDQEAMSDLYNGLLADPAVADHIAALLPNLDPQGLANFTNALMASEQTAELVNRLVEFVDIEATAELINSMLGEVDEDGTLRVNQAIVDATTEMLTYLDADALGSFVNALLADEDSNLVKFANELTEKLDTEPVAALVNKMLTKIAEDGSLVINDVMLDKLNQLLGYLDDEAGTFQKFLFDVAGRPSDDSDRIYGTDLLLQNMLNILDEEGNVDTECELFKSMEALFEPGQGLHEALFGELGVNDAMMDYVWSTQTVKKPFYMGKQPQFSSAEEMTTLIGQVVQYHLNELVESYEWLWGLVNLGDEYIHEYLVEGLLGPMIGAMVGRFFTHDIPWVSQGVRVVDMSFGTTPPWLKDNRAGWNDELWLDYQDRLDGDWLDPSILPFPDPEHDWRMGSAAIDTPPWERDDEYWDWLEWYQEHYGLYL